MNEIIMAKPTMVKLFIIPKLFMAKLAIIKPNMAKTMIE
jgi:hypothetical protein